MFMFMFMLMAHPAKVLEPKVEQRAERDGLEAARVQEHLLELTCMCICTCMHVYM